jgi:aminoglycoside phosphotransferase
VKAVVDTSLSTSTVLADAVHHLLAQGLIRAEDVVGPGVRAVDLSRSHPVILVEVQGGTGFVVKHPTGAEDHRQGSFENEVALYRYATHSPQLSSMIPTRLGPDEGGSYLTVSKAPGRPALELFAGGRSRARSLGVLLGDSLARWHRVATDPDALPEARPWILDLFSRRRPDFLSTNEGAGAFLAAVDDRKAGIERGLRALKSEWHATCLIHGDLRLDNCIVDAGRVVLIDWETAGWGDPAWDVASLVQEFVVLGDGTSLQPTDPVARAIRELLAAYAIAARCSEDELRNRLGPFLGARLLQRAVQIASWQPSGIVPENEAMARLAIGFLTGAVTLERYTSS